LEITSGCVLAPDSFATGVDQIMDKVIGKGVSEVTFGPDAYTDLDCVC